MPKRELVNNTSKIINAWLSLFKKEQNKEEIVDLILFCICDIPSKDNIRSQTQLHFKEALNTALQQTFHVNPDDYTTMQKLLCLDDGMIGRIRKNLQDSYAKFEKGLLNKEDFHNGVIGIVTTIFYLNQDQ